MSLGYNQLRPQRTTTLPGGTGAAVVYRRSKQSSPKSRSPRLDVPLLAPAALPSSRPLATLPPAPAPPASEQPHWVYATAAQALADEDTGDEVAAQGERVLLVYPMEGDDATGRVKMRLKRAHPVTGQLSYAWVCVCDPEQSTRPVVAFSTAP